MSDIVGVGLGPMSSGVNLEIGSTGEGWTLDLQGLGRCYGPLQWAWCLGS